MKKTAKLLGFIAMVTAFGFSAITVDAQNNSVFAGTWRMGVYELTINANGEYTYRENGINSTLGRITFTANQLTLTDTSAWNGAQWVQIAPASGAFGYTLTGNSLVLSNNSIWPFLNGTWSLR